MKEIPLTQGFVAQVSDEDYVYLSMFRWTIARRRTKNYAMGRIDGKPQLMHRVIMGNPELPVDHRDGDGLNNQRSNLRLATTSQNAAYSKKRPSQCKYKGAYAHQGKWIAAITVNYHQKHLGVFNSPEEAARAYDEAALKYFKEFAVLNFATGNLSDTEE